MKFLREKDRKRVYVKHKGEREKQKNDRKIERECNRERERMCE